MKRQDIHTFGEHLRRARRSSCNPSNGKELSQMYFAKLLLEECGRKYSAATIHYWETGKIEINKNDRELLIVILKILFRLGGLKTSTEGEAMLAAGNYRALNDTEKAKIFPGHANDTGEPRSTTPHKRQTLDLEFLLQGVFSIPADELRQISEVANAGPPPAWPRMLIALINKSTNHWTILQTLNILAWVWIWLVGYLTLTPYLHLFSLPGGDSHQTLVIFAGGTLILPLLIGAMIRTKDKPFWNQQTTSNNLTLRLYVYQGAYVGFGLGSFILVIMSLIQNQFGFNPSARFEILETAIPLVIGYIGAQLVPHNLWLTYNRLNLKDGWIFFIFVFFGPGLAWFLSEIKGMGLFPLLIGGTLLAMAMGVQYNLKGNTNIPILWWIIFWGIILLCQFAGLFFIQ